MFGKYRFSIPYASYAILLIMAAEVRARALRRRLDDKSYPWDASVKLCERVFLRRRLSHVATMERVVLEWLTESTCVQQPGVESEKKVLHVLRLFFRLLKRSEKEGCRLNLPLAMPMALSKWLNYASAVHNKELLRVICQLWKYMLKSGLMDQHFQENIEHFIYSYSTLIDTWVKLTPQDTDDQSYQDFLWIFEWSLKTAENIRGHSQTFLICEKLLRPSLTTLFDSGRADAEIISRIKSATEALLFPRDYEQKVREVVSFLFLLNANPTTYLSSFFSSMDKLIDSSMTESAFATTLFFYDIVFEKCRSLKSDLKFLVFVVLVRILGIELECSKVDMLSLLRAKNISIKAGFDASESSFHSLYCVLAAINRHLSSFITDDGPIISPLVWLRQLADFLFTSVNTRCASWFKCVRSLLILNCQTILPILNSVLKATWHSSNDSKEVVSEKNQLLDQLLETYTKMHQIPKFIRKMWICLFDNKFETSTLTFPSSFKLKLGDVVTNSAVGTSLDIWQLLNSKISLLYNHNCVGLVVDLLECVLSNIRVVDVSLPSSAVNLLVQLSRQSTTDCISKLVNAALSENKMFLLESSLCLAASWGELHIALLCFNPKYREEWTKLSEESNLLSPCKELSFVHFYIRPKEWKAIWKCGKRSSNPTINHLCRRLVLQKMKMVLLLEADDSDVKSQSVSSAIEFLISWEKFDLSDGEWSGNLSEMSEENVTVANWSSICDSFSMLEPHLDDVSAGALAKIVVATLDWENKPSNGQNLYKSLNDWSQKLINCTEFKESKLIQTSMISVICNSIAVTLNEIDGRGDNFVHKIAKSVMKLSQSPNDWLKWAESRPSAEEGQNYVWQTIEKSSQLLNKALITSAERRTSRINNKHISHLTNRFKLFQALPLEYFLPSNQVRCLLTTLDVAALLVSQPNVGREMVETLNLGLSNAIFVLDGRRSVWLFPYMDSVVLFSWLFHTFIPFVAQVENDGAVSGELVETLKKNCKLLLTGLLSLVIRSGKILEAFDKFISKVTFAQSCTSFALSCNVALLKSMQTMRGERTTDYKNKCSRLCIEYERQLSTNFVRYVLDVFESGALVEWIASDVQKAEVVLEGVSYTLEKQFEGSQAKWKKLLEISRRLAVEVATNGQEVECLRHSCHILSLISQKYMMEVFEDAWLAVGKLFELEPCSRISTDEDVAASLVSGCDMLQLSWIIQKFLELMSCCRDGAKLIGGADLWKVVVSSSLDAEKNVFIVESAELSFVQLNSLMEDLVVCHHQNAIPVIVHLLELEAAFCKAIKLSAKCVSLFVRTCLTCVSGASEVELVPGVVNLLDAVLEHQKSAAGEHSAHFVRLVQLLMQIVVDNSQQHILLKDGSQQLQRSSYAAQRLQRLLVQMSSLSGQFASTAPYVVASYVSLSSSVTIHSSVKSVLLEGVYALMTLFDGYAPRMVSASLDPTGREVFASLYETYNKYYLYKGKV